jgi:hypothetical protein
MDEATNNTIKKKRIITPEQREKMLAGRKAAAEKRKLEADKQKKDTIELQKQAEEYQKDQLKNAKIDKENQKILKEEFERIKRRIEENKPKLNKRLDDLPASKPAEETQYSRQLEGRNLRSVTAESPLEEPKIMEKIDAIVEVKKPVETPKVNEDSENENKYNQTIKQICSSMPNQKTKDIFMKAAGTYNLNLSLEENIRNLINECNNQITMNAKFIKESEETRKRMESERLKKEEEMKRIEQDDIKKRDYEKRLRDFQRLLRK